MVDVLRTNHKNFFFLFVLTEPGKKEMNEYVKQSFVLLKRKKKTRTNMLIDPVHVL